MNEKCVHDDLAAYALGALDSADAERVRLHLETCETCRRELKTYVETLGMIAVSVPQKQPDPGLKEKILNHVKESENAQDKQQKSWQERSSNKGFQLMMAWGVISLILIIVLGASNVLLWGRVQEHETAFFTIALDGTDFAPEASAMIVVPKDDVVGTLIVNHLIDLGEGQQYQLWLIRNGDRTSGAVFSVDEDGYDSVYLHLPDLLNTYDRFGVTIEPAGGSSIPTGDQVLDGSF